MQSLRLSLRILANLFFMLMGFYLFLRAVFLLYYHDKLNSFSADNYEIMYTFVSALKIDISTVSYILALTVPLLALYQLFKKSYYLTMIRWYLWLVLLFSLILTIGELGVYGEWGEKPGSEILLYFQDPTEMFNTNPWQITVVLLLFLAFVAYIFFRILKLIVTMEAKPQHSLNAVGSFILISTTFLVLGANGGITTRPLPLTDAYFSNNKFLNDAAVNTTYSFIYSLAWNQKLLDGENPFDLKVPQKQKEKILAKLMQDRSVTPSVKILTTKRPNIIMVVLESWSGDFISQEKEYQEVAPYFNTMANDGILFEKCYGSGSLSHEGLPAIISGWPAIDGLYISNIQTSKLKKLPSIAKSLKGAGYETLFLYGGYLNYGNIAPYISSVGFDHIYEADSFPDTVIRGPLGIHDEFAFNYFHQDLKSLNKPFFATIFTLSSHLPYVQPMEDRIHWGGIHQPYLNSIFYTDLSIKTFMETMKQEDYYANTLFIFVADHSHMTPKNYNHNDASWHHISMMLYGDVIKKAYQGMRVKDIVAQHDLASTLLGQLDINHTQYAWSRNVFTKSYQPSAYYTLKYGYGLITPEGEYAYHAKDHQVLIDTLPKTSKEARLYGAIYTAKLLEHLQGL